MNLLSGDVEGLSSLSHFWIHWVVRAGISELYWGREFERVQPQPIDVCALMGKARVLVWKSMEKRCPRWDTRLWGSLLPFPLQAPQESRYLQFSSLNVSRKAVIICLAEAGQPRTLVGPVRVSLHLPHTLLEADSSLPLPLQGQLSLCCRNKPHLAPPFLIPLPFCYGSLK